MLPSPVQLSADKLLQRLRFHPRERLSLFMSLPPVERPFILHRLTRHLRCDIIRHLDNETLLDIVEHLDPTKATDIIQLLPSRRRKKIIALLKEDLRGAVALLAEFDPHTAAGIMSVDYIQIDEGATIAEAARQVKAHEKRTGRFPLLIAMRRGVISGYVPGHALGLDRPSAAVRKHIHRITTIPHNADYREVLRLFKAHPHSHAVVTSEKGAILGVIYADTLLQLLEEKESTSLYTFAGVHTEETVTDSIAYKVRHRYQWLIINLGTAFLAAATVGLFETIIAQYVLLAVYMPIVAGMGGNAGTQTLAVLVRGIALNQITLANSWQVLKRELGAGFINGLINGLIIAAVVIAFNGDVKIAVILASAMIINLLVAAFFGTLVPLVMERLGKDPAASATIFITTATDVLGFLAFLGLATLLLM